MQVTSNFILYIFYYFKRLNRRFKGLTLSKKIASLTILFFFLKTLIKIIIYLRQDLLTTVLIYQNVSRHRISCTSDNYFNPVKKYNLFKYYYKNESSDNTIYNDLEFPLYFSQFKLCKTNQFKDSFISSTVDDSSKYSYYLNLTKSNLSSLNHIGSFLCIQELFYYLNEPLELFLSDNLTQISRQSLRILKKNIKKTEEFIEFKKKLTIIIIPYMNREKNLVDMLHNLHPFLQRQFLNYKLFVAEQINIQDPFNKGRLYNLAYAHLKEKYDNINCLILQDVDLVPESDYNVYECGENPRHLTVSIRSESDSNSNQEYSENLYELLIGGCLCMRPVSYEKINGFSNEFWFWGGEDDDMVIRMLAMDMCVTRPKPEHALYKMSKHKMSVRNPNRNDLLYNSVERMNFDGLSNLKDLDGRVIEQVEYDLYIKLKINVGSFKTKNVIVS